MKASKRFMAVAALCVAVMTGCGGGGGVAALPSASNLRVKVITYNDAGQVQVLSGAAVVLGDSTGAMVASAVTDANGIVTFPSPPQNATVTSAVTGTGLYSLHTFYDVNVAAITFNV